MADRYGDAELVVGQSSRTLGRPIKVFTKWSPTDPKVHSLGEVAAVVDLALARTSQTQIGLMQYHIWDYTNPSYLTNLVHLRTLQSQGKIGLLGLTNTDAAHLELLLHSGFSITANQVSVSVLDRRLTKGRLADLCRLHGVGILAYGVLLGGFIAEKWLGAPEPQDTALSPGLRKYFFFIHNAGGWSHFQGLLTALDAVAKKHGVNIATVAIRWVLDIDVVKAVIIGSRLNEGSASRAKANLAAFGIALDTDDRQRIAAAQENLKDLPGDCGAEYRLASFLAVAGPLSDQPRPDTKALSILEKAAAEGRRIEFHADGPWEAIAVGKILVALSCSTDELIGIRASLRPSA